MSDNARGNIWFFGVSSQSWLLCVFVAASIPTAGRSSLYTRRHGRGSRVELAHARRVPRPAGEGLELALAALLLGRARRADDAAVPLRRTARAAAERRKSGHVGPEPLGGRLGRGGFVARFDGVRLRISSGVVGASLLDERCHLAVAAAQRIHGSCDVFSVPSALIKTYSSSSLFCVPSIVR